MTYLDSLLIASFVSEASPETLMNILTFSLPKCEDFFVCFFQLVPLGSNALGRGNSLTHKINFRLTLASAAIGAPLFHQADRLDWHCNSSLWFPSPNVPLIAQISPLGFHHTKESCQRSLQCVTSPSATAVMFPLLLTSISPNPLFFPFQASFDSGLSRRLSPRAFWVVIFLNTHIKAGSKGGKRDRCFSYAFLLGYNEALERNDRESERSDKTFAEIFLQSRSFLPTTGNTSFVLMQY